MKERTKRRNRGKKGRKSGRRKERKKRQIEAFSLENKGLSDVFGRKFAVKRIFSSKFVAIFSHRKHRKHRKPYIGE